MVVTMLVLGIGNVVFGDYPEYHSESSIAPGIYGEVKSPDDKTGGWYIPDPGESSILDTSRDSFTNPTITIGGSGGTTHFDWATEFGDRREGASKTVTVDIVGGTNIFNHQNIYFGARMGSVTLGTGEEDAGQEKFFGTGEGQNVVVNFQDGDNTFTHRVVFGGIGGHFGLNETPESGSYTSGSCTVTFSGGNNLFQYHPTLLSQEWHKGNLHSTDSTNQDYNYYYNYFGVYFSAMSRHNNDNVTSGGAYVDFTGGTNTFDITVHFGGNYDLTEYCHTSTSSSDPDVSYKGENIINFAGGLNTFKYRTTFGAPDSTTTVNFTNGETSFTGSPTLKILDEAAGTKYSNIELYGYFNLSEGRAYCLDTDDGQGTNNKNTYRGNDLPYVFFGGKDLDTRDVTIYNAENEEYSISKDNTAKSKTTVNIDGASHNYKTLSFNTTAFFGGADERWLAGDQYYYNEGSYAPRFRWFSNSMEYGGEYSAIRKDSGVASLNLYNGNLTLGVVNTMKVVDKVTGYDKEGNIVTGYNENGEMVETGEAASEFRVAGVRDRYEQVRLIGAAAGSTFNATGGRITFEVKEHNLSDLEKNYDHGYFHELNKDGEFNETVLEAGMIAFDEISISRNTDIALQNVSKLIVNLTEGKEYITNTVFADTTNSNNYQDGLTNWINGDGEIEQLGTTIKLEELEKDTEVSADQKLTIEKYNYDKWFYSITVEDSYEAYGEEAGTEGVQTATARLRIKMKSFDDAFGFGNFGLNKEKIACVLKQDEDSKVYQALDYIISTSESAEAAAENFDQLIGASYASMANHQINRLTNMNTLLANQLMASDVAVKNAKYMAFCQCGQDPCCCGAGNACCRGWTAWANFHGMGGKTRMDNYFSGYDSESYDAMFALEYNDCEGFHAGVYFNYGESSFASSADLGWTNIDSTDYTLGLYMKWLALCGGGYGMLNTNIAWNDYESKRYFNDAPENYTGEYDGLLPSIYYERGWVWFCNRNCTLNPYFSLQYAYFHSDDFTESGYDAYGYDSELALSVSEVDHHSLRTFLGLRLAHDFWLGRDCDRRLTLRVNGAWIHDLLGECTPTIYTMHQVDSCGLWKVRGNDAGRDWANIGVGLDFNICKRLSALVDYNIFVNEYTTLHAGMASLRFEF